jgi:hypothetical protein
VGFAAARHAIKSRGPEAPAGERLRRPAGKDGITRRRRAINYFLMKNSILTPANSITS